MKKPVDSIRKENTKNHYSKMTIVVFMVRPAGLEPATFWFVARHSIQLSYERTAARRRLAESKGFEPSIRV